MKHMSCRLYSKRTSRSVLRAKRFSHKHLMAVCQTQGAHCRTVQTSRPLCSVELMHLPCCFCSSSATACCRRQGGCLLQVAKQNFRAVRCQAAGNRASLARVHSHSAATASEACSCSACISACHHAACQTHQAHIASVTLKMSTPQVCVYQYNSKLAWLTSRSARGLLTQGNREFIYLVPAAKHFADYRPYELKVVPHTQIAGLADYSTMSAAGVTHFFHGQVSQSWPQPLPAALVSLFWTP